MGKATRKRRIGSTRRQQTTDYNDPSVQSKMAATLDGIQSGKYNSIRDASTKTGLPYGTLRNRFLGTHQPSGVAHKKRMLLDDDQEAALVDWIRFLGMVGWPLCKAMFAPKVIQLCGKRPGKCWTRRFMRRHEAELKLKRPSGLDPKRATAFNYTVVQDHFQKLKNLIESKGIPWENIYNMDEKGIQLGGGRRSSGRKYFYSRHEQAALALRSDSLELVMVVESCAADGTAFLPGFIFAGCTIDDENMAVDDMICIGTSENGWTSDLLCTQWFKKSFVPQATARNTSGTPILLIFDGHGSHLTNTMIEVALKNDIELFCLPPHTTHRLQPLDVGMFSPLQKAWAYQCETYYARTSQGMQRQHVVREYMEARKKSFLNTTITTAWRKLGIRPLDPGIFREEDYAPSINTSSKLHVPHDYPHHIPSDFDIPDDAEEESADICMSCRAAEEPADSNLDNDEEFGSAGSISSDENDNEISDNEEHNGISERAGIRSASCNGEEENLDGCGRERFDAQPPGLLREASHIRLPSDSDHANVQCATSHMPETATFSLTAAASMPSSLSSMRTGETSLQTTINISTPSLTLLEDFPLRDPEETKHLDDLISACDHLERWNKSAIIAHTREIAKATIELRQQRNRAETHSVLMAHEHLSEKRKNLAKASKKKRVGVRISCEIVTSLEALERRSHDAAIRAEKESRKQERAERRAAKVASDAARQVQMMNTTHNFSGSLKSQKKPELLAIAARLNLQGINKKSARADLLSHIEQHFHDHPASKLNPCFVGLFDQRRGRAAARAPNEAPSAPILAPPQ